MKKKKPKKPIYQKVVDKKQNNDSSLLKDVEKFNPSFADYCRKKLGKRAAKDSE
jgi:hypothetical protein